MKKYPGKDKNISTQCTKVNHKVRKEYSSKISLTHNLYSMLIAYLKLNK